LHAQIAVDALNAGKHVFCEKPLARTAEQAELIRKAVETSGRAFQVGFVRRFDDEWLAWREQVREGAIGRPLVWRDTNAGFFNVAKWFTTEDQGGGPFIDGCVHNYDFGLYTFGPVEWAFSHFRSFRPDNSAFDTGTTTLRFASGDELMLAWSWGLAEGTSGTRVFEFLGPKGTISIPGDEPEPGKNRLLLTRSGGEKSNVTYPKNALGRAFELQMDEFVEVCQGKKQPRAGIKEGIESLRIALAVLESGRKSEKVYVESIKLPAIR
jgi:predicted dehydrogenase